MQPCVCGSCFHVVRLLHLPITPRAIGRDDAIFPGESHRPNWQSLGLRGYGTTSAPEKKKIIPCLRSTVLWDPSPIFCAHACKITWYHEWQVTKPNIYVQVTRHANTRNVRLSAPCQAHVFSRFCAKSDWKRTHTDETEVDMNKMVRFQCWFSSR